MALNEYGQLFIIDVMNEVESKKRKATPFYAFPLCRRDGFLTDRSDRHPDDSASEIDIQSQDRSFPHTTIPLFCSVPSVPALVEKSEIKQLLVLDSLSSNPSAADLRVDFGLSRNAHSICRG